MCSNSQVQVRTLARSPVAESAVVLGEWLVAARAPAIGHLPQGVFHIGHLQLLEIARLHMTSSQNALSESAPRAVTAELYVEVCTSTGVQVRAAHYQTDSNCGV